ncbi:MAG: YitT family protein [Lachnospiraceae bacterium]
MNYRIIIKEYGLMVLACLIYAIGISVFLDPNKLAPGGVSGLGIILSRFLPLETGSIVFMFNIPIMIVGFWKLGYKLIWKSFFCMTISSIFIDMIGLSGLYLTDDLFISAIGGSFCVATGIGIIMLQGGTTGGVDIIVKLLRKKLPHIKTGACFLMIDLSVVLLSAIVFRDFVLAMYALVVVALNAFVLDKVLYGTDGAKMIYIITDYSDNIAKRLMEELNLGVTFLQGKGAYSGKQKDVIFVVMKKLMAPKAEEVIKQEDPNAFMIVSSAHEIYGEGYKNIFGEKL